MTQRVSHVGGIALWLLIVFLPIGWRQARAEVPPRRLREPRRVRRTRRLIGTHVTITVVTTDPASGPRAVRAERAIKKAFGRIARIEALVSRWKPASEVSKINRHAGKSPVRVSEDTFRVLALSKQFARRTDGAFDITVGPFIRLWKEAQKRGRAPADAERRRASALVGADLLLLDADRSTAQLKNHGMMIDLGAIAKGYCVDQAIRALKAEGVSNALVDAGGDIFALGKREDRTVWRLGVQNPDLSSKRRMLGVVEVSDLAVATSGSYRQYRRIGARHYSHIIDPRSGVPADYVPSVTVIAPDATTADALATGLSVMGAEAGLRLVESMPGVEALLIQRRGQGLEFRRSSGFRAYEAEPVRQPVPPDG